MKAAVIHEFGPPEVFRHEDVADPQPGPGELIIKVAACGINRYDLYLRMGAVFTDLEMPHVMGADVAGTVAAVGTGVADWREGEEAIAAPGYPIDPSDWGMVPENLAPSFEVSGTHTWGGNAEFLRIPARFALKNESGLSPRQVAAMPLVLMTAVHAVETLGAVQPESKVLVQAGASGSGAACIQVAKAGGAQIATTIGDDEKIAFVEKMGADLVINHRRQNTANQVLDWTNGHGVDVVIDCVGGAVFEQNLKALKTGGILVNFGLVGGMTAKLNFRDLFFRQHQLRGSFMGSMEELRRGLALMAEGLVRPIVDREYPLSEVAEAHRYIESRAVKGKILLVP